MGYIRGKGGERKKCYPVPQREYPPLQQRALYLARQMHIPVMKGTLEAQSAQSSSARTERGRWRKNVTKRKSKLLDWCLEQELLNSRTHRMEMEIQRRCSTSFIPHRRSTSLISNPLVEHFTVYLNYYFFPYYLGNKGHSGYKYTLPLQSLESVRFSYSYYRCIYLINKVKTLI